jgi:hypothetical protein
MSNSPELLVRLGVPGSNSAAFEGKASSEGARVQHRYTVMTARLRDRLECVARCLVHGIHRGAEEQEEVRAHLDRPPRCFRVIHHL